MSIRGLALGGVVVMMAGAVVALVVALSGSPGKGSAVSAVSAEESESPVPAGVYAYMKVEFGDSWLETKTELVVMEGAEQVGSAPFGFVGTRPVFTTDGRYVYTVPLGDELIAVSAENGEVTNVPCEGCGDRQLECQCQTVVPFGGSRVAWLDGDNRLVHTDLAAKKPMPQRTDITVPVQDGFLDEKVVPHLIAGTDGAALAAYPHGSLPGDDLMPAYLVTLGDEPRRLDPGRPDSVERAAFNADGTRVALTGNQERACATVTVVDVASGEGETAPVSAEPGTECETHDVYIDSLWWGPDGALNVYFQAADENPDAEDGQARLEDGAWVDADAAPATEERRLSGDATVTRDDWTLTLEADGERTRIDTDVRYLTTAPR